MEKKNLTYQDLINNRTQAIRSNMPSGIFLERKKAVLARGLNGKHLTKYIGGYDSICPKAIDGCRGAKNYETFQTHCEEGGTNECGY